MKNVFLDCGTNFCQGLKRHIKKYNITKDWIIHTFEANPSTYQHAKNIIEKYLSDYNITIHNKAVWMEDSKRKLIAEHNTRIGILHQLEAVDVDPDTLDLVEERSLWIGGASNIMEDNFKPNMDVGDVLESETVDCIDFSRFILETFTEPVNIYLKLDIEGAEYSVLEKLIKTNALTNIKEITVEWHNRMLYRPYDQGQIEQELHNRNIKINSWH